MTGDGGGEAESWANAGRQFFLAEDQFYQARNVSFEEMLEAGIHCFLLAVHVCIYIYIYIYITLQVINKWCTCIIGT